MSGLSDFQQHIINDVDKVFLNAEEWAETVTYTFLDRTTKDIRAEVHLSPGGSHDELEAVIDIALDATIGIPEPHHGETIKRQVWPFEHFRIAVVSEAQSGMVALVCERIDQE